MSNSATHSPGRDLVLISNRNSGHNRDLFERFTKVISECEGIRHYPTDSATELAEVMAQLAASPPEVLAINGGDGTAALIFAHLLERTPFATLPHIVLLPGGTANMTAGDVGMKGSLLHAARRLCDWYKTPSDQAFTASQRYVLRVNTEEAAPGHYGMFFGTGAIIQGTEYAHRHIHSRGLRDDFSVGIGTLRTFWGIVRRDPAFDQPLPVRLKLAEEQDYHEFDIRILAISSLEQLFMGFRPFWGSENAALRTTCICRDAAGFLRRFPGILLGHPGKRTRQDPGYWSHNTSRVELLMDGSFNLDGEIVPVSRASGPVTISAAGPLNFLRLT